MPSAPTPWTTPLSGAPDAPLRFFVFPFAGGGSLPWRPWAALLPGSWRSEVVIPPGREARMREAPFTDMAPLVAATVAGLMPLLDRPFVFYGHSFGAGLAYETARALEAAGRGPAHLFVSGRRAPGRPRRTPVIRDLPDRALREAIGQLGGTPRAVLENDEIMAMILPVLRADFTVNDRYEPLPGPPLACPLTAFGGTEDREADRSDIEAWGGLTTGSAHAAMMPGGHFFIQAQGPALVALMQARLAAHPPE